MAGAKPKQRRQSRKATDSPGRDFLKKALSPVPTSKTFRLFRGWREPKQGEPSRKAIDPTGEALFEKSPSPDPSPDPSSKTFQVFFLLAQTKTKTAKSDFPAYFYFAVWRNFICFRGKQISSAIRGYHLSAFVDRYHRVRQPSHAPPHPKNFSSFFRGWREPKQGEPQESHRSTGEALFEKSPIHRGGTF